MNLFVSAFVEQAVKKFFECDAIKKDDDGCVDEVIFNYVNIERVKEVSYKYSSLTSSYINDKEEENCINGDNGVCKDDDKFENEQIDKAINDEFSIMKLYPQNKYFVYQ